MNIKSEMGAQERNLGSMLFTPQGTQHSNFVRYLIAKHNEDERGLDWTPILELIN